MNKQKFLIGEKFIGTEYNKKITQLWGDSAKFDFSLYYEKIDFIFIDGAHSFEYVKNDSEEALKMIRKRGIILWHDYHKSYPGVVRFLDNLFKKINLVRIKGTSIRKKIYENINYRR